MRAALSQLRIIMERQRMQEQRLEHALDRIEHDQMITKAKAFREWVGFMHHKHKENEALRKAAFHLANQGIFRAFGRWKSLWEKRSYLRQTVYKYLLRNLRLSQSQALRRWHVQSHIVHHEKQTALMTKRHAQRVQSLHEELAASGNSVEELRAMKEQLEAQ